MRCLVSLCRRELAPSIYSVLKNMVERTKAGSGKRETRRREKKREEEGEEVRRRG